MSKHVTLAPFGWNKLIAKLIDKSLDLESPTLSIHIDINLKVVTLTKTEPNKNNMAFSYVWEILDVGQALTQSYHFKLSGLALINTLNQLDEERAIKLTLFDQATFQLENRAEQLSLFDTEPSVLNAPLVQVDHKLNVSLINHSPQPTKLNISPKATFDCENTVLVQKLMLVGKLNQESQNNNQNLSIIFSTTTNDQLHVIAKKGTWFSALSTDLKATPSDSSAFEAELNVKTVTALMEILKQANGTITIVMTGPNIQLSQKHWQCTLPSKRPNWRCDIGLATLAQLDSNLFSEAPKIELTDHLPKLNTANQKQKGRIWLESNEDSSRLLNLYLNQDDTHSAYAIQLKNPLFVTNHRISISLWTLEHALRYFPSKVYWYYNDTDHSLILVDKNRQNQLALYADTSH